MMSEAEARRMVTERNERRWEENRGKREEKELAWKKMQEEATREFVPTKEDFDRMLNLFSIVLSEQVEAVNRKENINVK